MNADTPTTTMLALPARAAVALLTMQLRTATREAVEAETRAGDTEHGSAHEQLRERLAELIAERRRRLDDSLIAARNEADAAVAAARRTADAMVSKAATPAVAPIEASMPLVPVLAAPNETPTETPSETPIEAPTGPQSDIPSETPSATTSGMPTGTQTEAPGEAVREPDVTAASLGASLAVRDAGPVAPPVANVMIDAEGFARVFATVLASLLDERLGTLGSQRPIIMPAPVAPPAAVKQSFWTHARHPDVLLMGLTMIIVLVVLAAWLA